MTQRRKASSFSTNYETFRNQTGITDEQRLFLSESRQTVSDSLANSYNRCTELYLDAYVRTNRLGVFIDVELADYSLFVVRFNRDSPSTTPVEITTISPEGSVLRCTYGGEQIGPEFRIAEEDTEDFNITCTKNENREIPFSITTTDGPSNTVTIPRQATVVDQLLEDISVLTGELNRLRDQELVIIRDEAAATSSSVTALAAEVSRSIKEGEEVVLRSGSYSIGCNYDTELINRRVCVQRGYPGQPWTLERQ